MIISVRKFDPGEIWKAIKSDNCRWASRTSWLYVACTLWKISSSDSSDLLDLQSWSILFQPLSLKFTNSFLKTKMIQSLLKLCFNELGPIITTLVNHSLSKFFHRHLNKLFSIFFSKNQLYPWMISTTFVQFQTSTSFPKFSKKLLPPAFSLTSLLTHCLLFNLLTRSFILLKLLFSKFTMTSSLWWIRGRVRSLHSFFSTFSSAAFNNNNNNLL